LAVLANKSRKDVQRELELIRKLMDEDNLSDYEIMKQQQIPERTFYRYKKKLKTIYERNWQKTHNNNTQYAYHKFHDSLEDCVRGCKKLIDDPKTSAHDKIEAYKTMCSARQQLAQLEKKGPIFQPQLPNKVIPVDSKEITV